MSSKLWTENESVLVIFLLNDRLKDLSHVISKPMWGFRLGWAQTDR